MQNEIRHEWIYEQSPSEIWEYLTQTELIALWLMPNNFELSLGHEFQLRTNAMPALNLDGIFQCKVLEIVPLKKLVYSWKGGENGIFTLDTICEWTLHAHEKGTKLTLKHSGFKENNIEIFNGMTNGWLKKIEKMLDHMKTKKLQDL